MVQGNIEAQVHLSNVVYLVQGDIQVRGVHGQAVDRTGLAPAGGLTRRQSRGQGAEKGAGVSENRGRGPEKGAGVQRTGAEQGAGGPKTGDRSIHIIQY